MNSADTCQYAQPTQTSDPGGRPISLSYTESSTHSAHLHRLTRGVLWTNFIVAGCESINLILFSIAMVAQYFADSGQSKRFVSELFGSAALGWISVIACIVVTTCMALASITALRNRGGVRRLLLMLSIAWAALAILHTISIQFSYGYPITLTTMSFLDVASAVGQRAAFLRHIAPCLALLLLNSYACDLAWRESRRPPT